MTSIRRVRAVVLDFDGGERTLHCLAALLVTEWDGELEVVLVDNGSRQPVTDEVARRWPAVRIVRSEINRGFAGGANLGIGEPAEVDAIALVNNDAVVSRDWLRPLAATLDRDPRIGAACPKLLLHGRYRTLELTSGTHTAGVLDPRQVGVRVHAVEPAGAQLARGFYGPEIDPDGSRFEWSGSTATLEVPGDSGRTRLQLSADRATTVVAVSGRARTTFVVDRGVSWFDAALGDEAHRVINNVGTELRPDWYGVDRGYLEADRGQFDGEEDVPAWCGAAVLLRSDYLREVGLFDERLFVYCEDLELSLRGQRRGWRYRLAPASVVEHEHSATAISGSDFAEFHKERNRLVIVARYGSRRVLARTIVRYLLATLSYARRDVVAPLLRGQRPRTRWVALRLRALAQFPQVARRSDSTSSSRRRRARQFV